MLWRRSKALACIFSMLAAAIAAEPLAFGLDISVTFGNGTFYDPPKFLDLMHDNPDLDRLRRALDAIVLIGGRASAVIVSEDGLVMTARHTVQDLSFTNDDCHAIPLFLFHERDASGEMDTRLRRLTCDRILVNEYADDFILMKLKVPEGVRLPYAEPERDIDAITPGMTAFAVGHPHALSYERGVKKVSVGRVVLYRPNDEELPHFLHQIDTEGGSSGGAILSARGKLIGIHFRGVQNYGPGVEVELDGAKQVIHRFNVALPVPYLLKKHLP